MQSGTKQYANVALAMMVLCIWIALSGLSWCRLPTWTPRNRLTKVREIWLTRIDPACVHNTC